MRRPILICAGVALVTAALFAVLLDCDCPSASSDVATRTEAQVASRARQAAFTIEPILPMVPRRGEYTLTRNVFQYGGQPMLPAAALAPPSAPSVASPRPRNEEIAAAPRERPFPYVWIGSFGPDRFRLFVFRGDGEILIRRIGEEIGNGFVLRGAGIESVTVADEVDGDRRIGIGG